MSLAQLGVGAIGKQKWYHNRAKLRRTRVSPHPVQVRGSYLRGGASSDPWIGGGDRGVLKILSHGERERAWALPCRGIIGTPCIIACVPYLRCAVCDWIGGDGSREIADPN